MVLTGNAFAPRAGQDDRRFRCGRPAASLSNAPLPCAPPLGDYDFGDLAGPQAKPYAVFPESKSRRIDKIEILSHQDATEIVVQDRYDVLAGRTRLELDKEGKGLIRCEHVYRGEKMDSREAGIRLTLDPKYQTLHWRRWAEWGSLP